VIRCRGLGFVNRGHFFQCPASRTGVHRVDIFYCLPACRSRRVEFIPHFCTPQKGGSARRLCVLIWDVSGMFLGCFDLETSLIWGMQSITAAKLPSCQATRNSNAFGVEGVWGAAIFGPPLFWAFRFSVFSSHPSTVPPAAHYGVSVSSL